jgi:hypothetical protein
MAELRFKSQFILTAPGFAGDSRCLNTALTEFANGAVVLELIVKRDFLWYAYILSSR